MLASQRIEFIKNEIKTKGAVNATELEKALNVSSETVRRDLLKMEEQKLLKRVHGGAIALNKMKEFEDLEARNKENGALKQSLSKIAVKTVVEGDVIAVDSGSGNGSGPVVSPEAA